LFGGKLCKDISELNSGSWGNKRKGK